MRDFIHEHRALIVKHARELVRANAEKLAVEDVAREIEIELGQLARDKGLVGAQVTSPDALLRQVVKHAAGRAKRRRKLIEQVAAGDDLQAFAEDLAALDRDLPDVVIEPTPEAREARATLERVKSKLTPKDALVFALLVDDDGTIEEVARLLAMPLAEVEVAMSRIIDVAAVVGVPEAKPPARPSLVDAAERP